MGDPQDDGDFDLDSEGWNDLHFAAKNNDVATIKKAFEDKSPEFVTDKTLHSPLHVAAVFGSIDALKLILDNINLEQASLTNYELMNVFHSAVEHNQLEVVQILMNHAYFKNALSQKDIYGRTPFDIALQLGLKDLAKLLSPQPIPNVTKLPAFDSFVDISQDNLEDSLIEYLESEGRDPYPFVDIFGECNGWEFLYQIYLSNDAEEEFFAILTAVIDHYDLSDPALPAILTKKYKNFNDVFEQLINDLSICHALAKAMREVNLNIFQSMRRKQYDLNQYR